MSNWRIFEYSRNLFLIFFKVQNWDSCLKTNKYFVIFVNSTIRHIPNSFSYEKAARDIIYAFANECLRRHVSRKCRCIKIRIRPLNHNYIIFDQEKKTHNPTSMFLRIQPRWRPGGLGLLHHCGCYWGRWCKASWGYALDEKLSNSQ